MARPLRLPVVLTLALALVAGPIALRTAHATPVTRAGVAVVDATWHVGASAGQYSGDNYQSFDSSNEIFDPASHGVDP